MRQSHRPWYQAQSALRPEHEPWPSAHLSGSALARQDQMTDHASPITPEALGGSPASTSATLDTPLRLSCSHKRDRFESAPAPEHSGTHTRQSKDLGRTAQYLGHRLDGVSLWLPAKVDWCVTQLR